ncbi:MAG: UDP-N-acetylmuramate dehydrogenase [Bacteroidota bacterium]
MTSQQQNLQAFNTFGLPSVAEKYLAVNSLQQLYDWAPNKAPELVLGGGSNLLLLDQVPGLTAHILLKGIELLQKKGEQYEVRVGAGVNWHQFVLYALSKAWHGLENLALIPGTVGAAPVQNIGAYGVEVAKRILRVHAYEYGNGPVVIEAKDCAFAYRDSRFKAEPGRFLITSVDFTLGGNSAVNTSYGAIQQRLEVNGVKTPLPGDVARAVIEIRNQKLPDWSLMGNSGSFFKNPVVDTATFQRLQKSYPDLPNYPLANGQTKLAAGWLIDQAGWRGKRDGEVGCYKNQALVIVNHGEATGREVLAFSQKIQASILEKFGIALEREVRLVGV